MNDLCLQFKVESINQLLPEVVQDRTLFTNLIPVYPYEQLKLETTGDLISGRIMDILCPIGKGQRSLIVSPPKAGKTSLMKEIANAISKSSGSSTSYCLSMNDLRKSLIWSAQSMERLSIPHLMNHQNNM